MSGVQRVKNVAFKKSRRAAEIIFVFQSSCVANFLFTLFGDFSWKISLDCQRSSSSWTSLCRQSLTLTLRLGLIGWRLPRTKPCIIHIAWSRDATQHCERKCLHGKNCWKNFPSPSTFPVYLFSDNEKARRRLGISDQGWECQSVKWWTKEARPEPVRTV